VYRKRQGREFDPRSDHLFLDFLCCLCMGLFGPEEGGKLVD
jgi:hypothetical protein